MKRIPIRRSCGPCEACCAVLSVDEIGKSAEATCPHQLSLLETSGPQDRTSGCSVYATRPLGCRTFQCLWLAEADPKLQKYARHRKAPRLFGPSDRPDLSGLVFHAPAVGAPAMVSVVREVWPGVSETEAGRGLIERYSARRVVVLICGDRRTLFGPSEELEKVTELLGLSKRKEG